MTYLTGTNVKILCLSFLLLNSRAFGDREELGTGCLLFNTFIMLHWGVGRLKRGELKQLHCIFWNTGSCLVSAFMLCSCLYVIVAYLWSEVSIQQATESCIKTSATTAASCSNTRTSYLAVEGSFYIHHPW